MKTLLTSLLLLITAVAMAADNAKHVDAEGAAKLIAEGKVVVVDVRTREEFSEGHLKSAINVDVLEPDFEARLGKLDKTKPVLVHCQAGGRSTRSLPVFEKLGFKEIYHLDGGYGGWVESGKPVVKP